MAIMTQQGEVFTGILTKTDEMQKSRCAEVVITCWEIRLSVWIFKNSDTWQWILYFSTGTMFSSQSQAPLCLSCHFPLLDHPWSFSIFKNLPPRSLCSCSFCLGYHYGPQTSAWFMSPPPLVLTQISFYESLIVWLSSPLFCFTVLPSTL